MTRKPADPRPLRVRFGEFELDEANALLLRGGRAIDLAPTPFGLLCALVRHPGRANEQARASGPGLGPPLRE